LSAARRIGSDPVPAHRSTSAARPDAEPSTEPDVEWLPELIERAIHGLELPDYAGGAGLRGPGRTADHLVGQAVGHRLGRGEPAVPVDSGRVFVEVVADDDTRDFGIGKRLPNLPALREIGFSANRRPLGVQRLSHNPICAAEAFTAVHEPIITDTGQRTAGLRLGNRRVHTLLQALLVFRLLPAGFRNRDLRELLGGLLGRTPGAITARQVSYDLRRLRAHGLITRTPRTHRYRLTDTGGDHAKLPTSIPGCCNPASPSSPTPTGPQPAPCAPPRTPTSAPSINSPRRPDSPPDKLDSILPTSSPLASLGKSVHFACIT
jgi:hypothetical protein